MNALDAHTNAALAIAALLVFAELQENRGRKLTVSLLRDAARIAHAGRYDVVEFDSILAAARARAGLK